MKTGRATSSRKYTYAQLTYLSSIRSKEWKFIDNASGEDELFDLKSDPQEKINLVGKNKEIASKLESELHRWNTSLPVYKDHEDSFQPEIDEETREKIKKTGYW